MLARDTRRSSLCVGSIILFFYIFYVFHHDTPATSPSDIALEAVLLAHGEDQRLAQAPKAEGDGDGNALSTFADDDISGDPIAEEEHHQEIEDEPQKSLDGLAIVNQPDEPVDDLTEESLQEFNEESVDDPVDMQMSESHGEIFSLSTSDRKYFSIDFGEKKGMNPNIIPHPELQDTWIVVAQEVKEAPSLRFTELVCDATFDNGVLRCTKPPSVLPIAPTAGDGCQGDLDHLQMNLGPHDARVFLGPTSPLVVYGSNSRFTCFGQFVQDLRALVDWKDEVPGASDFRIGTELQRPHPWGSIEKNWFLFWDVEDQVYVHYDLRPKRGFAKLSLDGSVTPDLAVFAEGQDTACMTRLMPPLSSDLESIHQATNSLRVTLCARDDASCHPDEGNTFIFVIYQHKAFYNFHSVYEPYVMLFRQQAPFELYAMSKLPLWIHGRGQTEGEQSSNLFYITSMSWKRQGQNYDGYLDDEMFLAFGIEDRESAGIDVRASDLLINLELCNGL